MFSSIQIIGRLFSNPYLSCFLYVCRVCSRTFRCHGKWSFIGSSVFLVVKNPYDMRSQIRFWIFPKNAVWESVFKITFFFSNRIRWSISKRVLRSRFSSQTWDCDVLGCKKLCYKSLTSGAWSSRTNVNLKPQTWRQGPGDVTSWRSRFAENAEKPQS